MRKALLLLLIFPGLAGAQELPLRIVTFNAWGLRWVTPSRAARIEAAARSLAELRYDVVALQEVWVAEDRALFIRVLKNAGLTHSAYFPAGFAGSGILLLSRWPISRSHYRSFALAGNPYRLWHLDYYAGKGWLSAVIETPRGPVRVVNTHMQAGYPTREYEYLKLAQAVELGEALAAGELPLIVVGDFNYRASDPGLALIAARAGLRLLGSSRVDHILIRDGARLRIEGSSSGRALDAPAALADGTTRRLSDHAAMAARLILRPGAPRRPSPRAARALSVGAAASLRTGAGLARTEARVDLINACVWLLLGAWLGGASRDLRRRGFAVVFSALALLIAAGYFYSALVYQTGLAAGYEAAAAVLLHP